LLLHDGAAAKALIEFQETIRIAHQSGARCIEIRATLSLCHLLLEQGRSKEAQRQLSELLESIPPELDSPEIRVVRALLARFKEEHLGQQEELEMERLLSTAPWESGHI
jgi:hypothetical protein